MTIDREDFPSFVKFANELGVYAETLNKDTFKKYVNYYIDEVYKLQDKGLIHKEYNQ